MKALRQLALAAVAGICLAGFASPSRAQTAPDIGPAPDCPYGFYDSPPYACAPYGYYGPEWFIDGDFIGAGPWFHGPPDFHARVDGHVEPHRPDGIGVHGDFHDHAGLGARPEFGAHAGLGGHAR